MSKPNSKANEAHLDNIHWEEARDSGYPIIDKGTGIEMTESRRQEIYDSSIARTDALL